MRRNRRPTLRGSVTQSTNSVRVRETVSRRSAFLRAGIVGGVLLLLILFTIWAWQSGWIHQQESALAESTLHLTQKAHFAVTDIMVEGRQQTGKEQLAIALDATLGSPIFAFDPHAAEARIAKLPWVSSVTVERHLPDTIFVRLTERMPMARWQHDNHLTVIDTQGKILPDANPDQFTQLPLIVGAGAPAEGKSLLDMLSNYPSIDDKMTAAVRVGERRWDLHLDPKIVARLPESEVPDALKRLSILITEQKILERDIVAIDLRLPDRLIIEPGTASSAPQRPGTGPTGDRL